MHFRHQRSPSPGESLFSQSKPQRAVWVSEDCVHQGSLLCGRVRSQIILPGLRGGKILLSFIHFAGNMVVSMRPFTDSEPDHVNQYLDIHRMVCPGKEEGSKRWCVASKPDVSSPVSLPVLCICANKFTFPDPVLAL